MSDEPLTEQELDDLEARGARCASAKLPGPLHRRLVAQARRAAALAAEHAALRDTLEPLAERCHVLAALGNRMRRYLSLLRPRVERQFDDPIRDREIDALLVQWAEACAVKLTASPARAAEGGRR